MPTTVQNIERISPATDIDIHVERGPRIITWGLNYKAPQKFNNRAKNIAGLN